MKQLQRFVGVVVKINTELQQKKSHMVAGGNTQVHKQDD